MLPHKSVIAARGSSWIPSQRTKVGVALQADPLHLGMFVEFHAAVVSNCWGVGFGQGFWCSGHECFLLLLIPLGEVVEVA